MNILRRDGFLALDTVSVVAFYKKNKETLKEKDFKLFVLTGFNIFMCRPCRWFGSFKLWLDSGFVIYDHDNSYFC